MSSARIAGLLALVSVMGVGHLMWEIPRRLGAEARTSGVASNWHPPEEVWMDTDPFERIVTAGKMDRQRAPFRTERYIPPPPPQKKEEPPPPPKTSETAALTYTGLYRSDSAEPSVFILVGAESRRVSLGDEVVGPYRLGALSPASALLIDGQEQVVATLPFRETTSVEYPLTEENR